MEILNLGIDYGTIATLTAKTTILETGEGSEQRNCEWGQCLLNFQIGERTLNNDELAYLQLFHEARKGRLESFLFKDWSDYIYQCSFVGDGVETEFQLFKTYTVGSQLVNRAIQFPKTITVLVNGVEQTEGFTVANLGILTFDVAPTGTIIVEGEFYVPVRFDQDDLKFRFNAIETYTNRKIYTLESTTLTEIRLDNPLSPDPIPAALNHIIDLGYDLDTLGGKSYNTTINPIAGGFEWRSTNWLNPKGAWDIGSRSLLRSELDYLISLFRVCRGRCVGFQYNDYGSENTYKVRFGEDAISFRFDAYEKGTERVIFNLSGVPIVQSSPYPKLDSTTYIIPLIDNSGSMDEAIPFINQALADLRPILKDSIYGGEQTAVDKYFKSSILFTEERYLREVAQNYRDNINEPKKYLFLLWENEAASNDSSILYHTFPRNFNVEPSQLYNTDYNNFLIEYQSMIYFSCLIINAGSNPVFKAHLFDSIQGLNRYLGLKQYGFWGQYEFPIDASASDIFNLLTKFMFI